MVSSDVRAASTERAIFAARSTLGSGSRHAPRNKAAAVVPRFAPTAGSVAAVEEGFAWIARSRAFASPRFCSIGLDLDATAGAEVWPSVRSARGVRSLIRVMGRVLETRNIAPVVSNSRLFIDSGLPPLRVSRASDAQTQIELVGCASAQLPTVPPCWICLV